MSEPLTQDQLDALAREAGGEAVINPAVPTIETRSVSDVTGVNFAERIVTVLAVPYEQPTLVPFRRDVWNEVFSRSAFTGMDATTRRIPATACLDVPADNHSGGKLVGRVHSVDPSHPEGLLTELKISRTPMGDETLELANDRNLSVSVGFMIKGRLDQTLDTRSKTRRINRAFLDHVAFVAQPAYEGAKILAVRNEGASGDGEMTATPLIEEFLNDDIFKWAQARHNRSGA